MPINLEKYASVLDNKKNAETALIFNVRIPYYII